ncbi:MAG: efflux RND transporter periplasmic adaptor subunit [Bacteroidales bacterium]|nr:efflux RND transporter periplasmic adaptor subunit [Bacteroidales bacterium]
MKKLLFTLSIISLVCFSSCKETTSSKQEESIENEEIEETGMTDVILTDEQVKSLNIHIGTVLEHNFTGHISLNGSIETMPQSEASITSYIGANVSNILVHEGQEVRQGQVIAHISHPDLIELQNKYCNACARFLFVNQEFQRQKKLYENNACSGKEFQQIQSEYNSLLGDISSSAAQLILLGIDTTIVRKGKTIMNIPIKSPINGTIEQINVEIGQYSDPQQSMFHIVNSENLFVDFLAYEKDLAQIEVGQTIEFNPSSLPERKFHAEIFSIGKQFTNDTKTIHVRAKILDKKDGLITGMYVQGKVMSSKIKKYALHEEGIVDEDGKSYIFSFERNNEDWIFHPIEITKGQTENDTTEVIFPCQIPQFLARDNAYYLLSEMKKGETGED